MTSQQLYLIYLQKPLFSWTDKVILYKYFNQLKYPEQYHNCKGCSLRLIGLISIHTLLAVDPIVSSTNKKLHYFHLQATEWKKLLKNLDILLSDVISDIDLKNHFKLKIFQPLCWMVIGLSIKILSSCFFTAELI